MDNLSFVLGFIMGGRQNGGGGSVEGVHTVTFMSEDGSAVLYERLVVDGDDCANVVDRGLLATPTKESTVQYDYTYSGWSLTSGGSADASALKSVTADRTVYAAFNSSTRYYTIIYYDGDTVLKTESLPYGSMPSYTPEKDGFSFDGWSPALATVTGDASYSAQWLEKITFAGGSWADIARIAESGEAQNYFAVGDKRTIEYGESTFEVAIAGFNHDDLADGSGKAGISIVCTTVPNFTTTWSNHNTSGNWYPYYHNKTYDHWYLSNVYTKLENTILINLPAELQAVIKSVTKTCDNTNQKYAGSLEFSAKLWALSLAELGYNGTKSEYLGARGSKYDLFTAGDMVEKYDVLDKVYVENTTTVANYWTRQLWTNGTWAPMCVKDRHATTESNFNTNEYYIRFGFCI